MAKMVFHLSSRAQTFQEFVRDHLWELGVNYWIDPNTQQAGFRFDEDIPLLFCFHRDGMGVFVVVDSTERALEIVPLIKELFEKYQKAVIHIEPVVESFKRKYVKQMTDVNEPDAELHMKLEIIHKV